MALPLVPIGLAALAGAALLLPRTKNVATPGARSGPSSAVGETGYQNVPQTSPNLPSYTKFEPDKSYMIEMTTVEPYDGSSPDAFFARAAQRIESEILEQNNLVAHDRGILGTPTPGKGMDIAYGVTYLGAPVPATLKAPALSGVYVKKVTAG